jgi:predicted aconitase with swiveling domain
MSAADATLSVRAEILLPFPAGSPPATGRALALTHPISFWGGVDPSSGAIIDARHPQRGECVAGRILLLPGTIGSSSAAAVMLELVHAGHAPAAIVLHEPDAILLLGCIVAQEMGWPAPPALKLERDRQAAFSGLMLSVSTDGVISVI